MKEVGLTVLMVVQAMVQFVAIIRPSEAITCGEVDAATAPCLTYLTQGGSPSSECCSGVKSLLNRTPNQQDRRTACECGKAAATRYPDIKPDAAFSLPALCGIQTNAEISIDVDCQSIP